MTLIDQRYDISAAERIDMLRRLLLYWDGQWFLQTVEEFGLEAAIRTNARVRASFGRLEMRAILKATHKKRADDLADALILLNSYLEVFMGERLKAQLYLTSETEASIVVWRCPAYEGARRAGLERTDQACVACEGVCGRCGSARCWPTPLSRLRSVSSRDEEMAAARSRFAYRKHAGNPLCIWGEVNARQHSRRKPTAKHSCLCDSGPLYSRRARLSRPGRPGSAGAGS